MKNLLLVAVLAFFGALMFASCKKDYKCTCKISVPLASWDTTIISEIKDAKKKDAKSQCEGTESTWQGLTMGLGTVDCSI